jgi:hypothetical protein
MDGYDDRIDPVKWRPLIMSFCQFFGLGGIITIGARRDHEWPAGRLSTRHRRHHLRHHWEAMIALERMAPPTAIDEELAWDAVCRRDTSYDGKLFFGVLTTGVHRRPSCRPPGAAQNVRFTPRRRRRDGCAPASAAVRRAEPRRRPGWPAREHIRQECDGGEALTLDARLRVGRPRPPAAHLPRRRRRLAAPVRRLCRLERLKGELRQNGDQAITPPASAPAAASTAGRPIASA